MVLLHLLLFWKVFFRKPTFNGLYTPFGSPVRGTETFLTLKEGSTFLSKPLFPQGREDVTALRCSEPLRYKVGGPIKGLAMFVRAGTTWGIAGCSLQLIVYS